MKRALLLVLDSFGIGASADAERFGDDLAAYRRGLRPWRSG